MSQQLYPILHVLNGGDISTIVRDLNSRQHNHPNYQRDGSTPATPVSLVGSVIDEGNVTIVGSVDNDYGVSTSEDSIPFTNERKVKFIGLLSDEYTNIDDWSRNLKETGIGDWCIAANAGNIHTPKLGDIIAVRTGMGTNAKIIYYVEVKSHPIVNSTYMTEGYDMETRTARHKGNSHIHVSIFKDLTVPHIGGQWKFISKDLQHPNQQGIMKRQTTFKPIDHIYEWKVNKNTNVITITKYD
jgi:hypothetical protein